MNRLIILCTLCILLTACNGYQQGPGDLQYRIHHDAPGETIRRGDFLSVNFIHRTQEGVFLSSSYETGHPVFFDQQKPFFKGDIFTGLKLLSEGDSATFLLNFDSMQIILNVPRPAHAKGKYLAFTVKVEKVIHRKGMSDRLFDAAVRKFVAAEALRSRAQEPMHINNYIAAHRLTPTQTNSGLQYVVMQTGNGLPAQRGDTVHFHYTGRYITGKIFDTSNRDSAQTAGILKEERRYQPDSAIAGIPKTIPGIDSALQLFPEGSKVTLIIPSKLAYGEYGNALFPPYTPLVFEVAVERIGRVKSGAKG